jgi:hypothetical protein
MKKYLISMLLVVASTFAFTAQATLATTVSGFDQNHTFIANASPFGINAAHLDGGGNLLPIPAPVGNTLINFVHDYFFTAVADTIATVTTGVTVGVTIPSLFMQINALTAGDPNPGGTGPIAVLGDSVSLGYTMTAGNDYQIIMLGGGSIDGQYSLKVSAVPVPAAAWLFGSALLGLVGFRRKAKMAVSAA